MDAKPFAAQVKDMAIKQSTDKGVIIRTLNAA